MIKTGKIYKITDDKNTMTYIGSTLLSLKTRLKKHKQSVGAMPKYIRNNPNCILLITELAQYDVWCETSRNSKQLRAYEQLWINKYKFKNLLNDIEAFNVLCNKCYHGNIKCLCKECKGTSICIHNRVKRQCKECGGSAICVHNKFKQFCKECGGTGICVHNKFKRICKECDGKGLCKHKKNKQTCRECGGKKFCEHDKQKSRCKECGGKGICKHNKDKYSCKECGGTGICKHNRRKEICKECGGKGLCKHNKYKSKCKECSPVYCEVCEKTYSKGTYNRHIKTDQHINNTK